MGRRIRGEEGTVSLTVEGQLQDGSFTKVRNFKWMPKADIQESDFLGESSTDFDLQHHGYGFSFECDEEDNKVEEAYRKYVTAQEAGADLPKIVLNFTKRYRAGVPSKTLSFEQAVFKLDEQGMGGRKDYTKNSCTGAAKTMVVR